jgi:hypothetical protein
MQIAEAYSGSLVSCSFLHAIYVACLLSRLFAFVVDQAGKTKRRPSGLLWIPFRAGGLALVGALDRQPEKAMASQQTREERASRHFYDTNDLLQEDKPDLAWAAYACH